MSEAVALNKKSQSRFVKKVKNMKDKAKKGVLKIKEGIKKQRKSRGLIYIGHIPHGFYEEEMKQYFKQFGKVTNVKVSRSRKTGHSKGYGFVEFLVPEVAQIAAETMDNYLMFNRRLICKYIPPEKQHRYLFVFKQWSTKYYPLKTARKMHLRLRNKNTSEEKSTASTKKMVIKIKRKMDKLAALGINHKFIPSHAPDDMINLLKNKEANVDDNIENNTDANIEGAMKIRKTSRSKMKQASGFKVHDLQVIELCKELKTKSLKTIQKKKEKLKKNTVPKLSFMQNERLKRLAVAQITNNVITKRIDKFKQVNYK